MDELTRLRAENEAMREYGRQIRAKDQAGYMSRKQMRTCIAALTAERDQLAKAAQDAEYSGPLAYYIPLVERLEADNAALRAALAVQWSPVADGERHAWDAGEVDESVEVRCTSGGETTLDIYGYDDDSDYAGTYRTVSITLPSHLRLCQRRAPAQEQQP